MTSSLPPDVAAARIRVGDAYRSLGHAIVGHQASAQELDDLADLLCERTGAIRSGEQRVRSIERPSGDWGPAPLDGEEMFSFDERPISGRAAPYGLGVRIVRDGDEVVGHVTLDSAHEGAPGRSHGGIVSALFDDVYGFVLTILAQPAFTGTLTIRYEQGVPIHRPLECRVRLDRREGRKLLMSGELSGVGADGAPMVFTRSTAVFIAIDEAAFGASARP
ncbi:PaaI family thioesterase [Ilumatobacter sp.]|uniref:PaaI family thioesterase n=1 Tax=Ilumatobacter sp. TaxID=1967498 RepID=UPI003C68B11F